ncbi:MAG: DUF3631 domain-containing protein [Pseudomonadota bacterium]|nr:DUF3631 domain-containing protein [Gammaproteobacteria bacterium]MDQ3581388.1 DUF3631 domain-containing protein [Pseudomonadota bacterium]
MREAHPYLARKGVPSVPSLREINAAEAAAILGYASKSRDEPLTGRLLVVPLKIGGELSTVELIDEAGRQSALYGGAKAGGHWAAQPLPDSEGAGLTLLIGEGVATVLSAIEATGYPGIAALSCSNLPAVAREMRERFPAAVLVILADLVRATGEPDPHAIEAARAIGGRLAVPDFGENGPDGSDFNDLHRARGAESVRGCVERATSPGGGEDPQDAVARLATLSPIEYDRVRQTESDALGVRVTTLDAEVEKARRKMVGDGNDSQGEAVLFPEIEPWPEPVDGAELLTDLAAKYRRHVVLPEHAPAALALWTLFTHAIPAVNVAPILAITSPEKRCGKSAVIALLRHLARRPLPSANISAPALFRSVEAWSPTLLIDEGDTFLRNNDELRGVLNSGHTRDSAFVIRTVGEDHEPRRFSTWGAKTIALIGKLPDTLADRSIEVRLKRKLASESVEKVRHADPDLFSSLVRRCARWTADHIDEIRAARPSMPDGLHDRAEDNWEPLLAIADLAGGPCPEQARGAALALSGGDDAENHNIRVQLLADIRDVFASTQRDRLPTVELIAELSAMEERPWCEANRGRPISARWLAARLRAFGITVGAKRSGETVFKGYKRDQFNDAFKRYLPPLPPGEPASDSAPSDRSQDTPSPTDPLAERLRGYNVGGARVAADFGKVTSQERNRSENATEPSCGAGCNRVTAGKPPQRGEGYEPDGDRESFEL